VEDLDSESRKLPSGASDKIRKFSRVLNKFHKAYLQDCKKAIRLKEINHRYEVNFELEKVFFLVFNSGFLEAIYESA